MNITKITKKLNDNLPSKSKVESIIIETEGSLNQWKSHSRYNKKETIEFILDLIIKTENIKRKLVRYPMKVSIVYDNDIMLVMTVRKD